MAVYLRVFLILSAVIRKGSTSTQNNPAQYFRLYNGYSIKLTSGITVSNSSFYKGIPQTSSCVFSCSLAANCYAATLFHNGTCSLQLSCAHVVLIQNSQADTYVDNSLAVIGANPVIDLPLLYQCNIYSQFGTRSYSSTPYLNYEQQTASVSNNYWSAASKTLYYTTANSASFSSNAYLLFSDSKAFNVFSSGASFTISFYFKCTSNANPQVVFLFSNDVTNAGSHCMVGMWDNCGGGYCLFFKYFKNCDGLRILGPNAQVEMQMSANSWYHVAVVYNNLAGTYSGYLNGVLDDSTSFSGAGSTPKQFVLGSGSVYEFLIFGFGKVYSFSGSIFCFQMFQNALSAADLKTVAAHCTSGGLIIL